MLGTKTMTWIFALIAVLAIAGAVGTMSKSQEGPKKQEQTEQAPSEQQNDPRQLANERKDKQTETWAEYQETIKQYWNRFLEFSKKWHEAIVAISTAFIAAFTLLLVGATALLWSSGERHAERQLRAYVSIFGGSITLTHFNDMGQAFYIDLKLRNSGQTPGYNYATWIEAKIEEPASSPFPTTIDPMEGRASSIIGPQTDSTLSRAIPVSAEELQAIRAGTKQIFIWGRADFKDAFDRPRYFTFRSKNGHEVAPGGTWTVGPHKDGYDAN